MFLQFSDCKLLLSEDHSTVKVCSSYEVGTKLLSLIHLPVKESRDYYSLGDIVANGHSLDGRIINVLAAVRSVSQNLSKAKFSLVVKFYHLICVWKAVTSWSKYSFVS